MIGGPDVVEELNLDHGLQPAGRQPDGPADDVRFGERRVVDAIAAELALQTPCDLEDAAFALHFLEVLLATDVGDVLAEYQDPGVARHFILHAGIEQIHHGGRLAREMGIVFGIELLGRGIDIRRVDPQRRGFGLGLRRRERHIGGDLNLLFHLRLDRLDLALSRDPFFQEVLWERRQRVTFGFFFTFARGLVEDFIVGEGVRVGSSDVRMHDRRPLALAAPFRRAQDRLIR